MSEIKEGHVHGDEHCDLNRPHWELVAIAATGKEELVSIRCDERDLQNVRDEFLESISNFNSTNNIKSKLFSAVDVENDVAYFKSLSEHEEKIREKIGGNGAELMITMLRHATELLQSVAPPYWGKELIIRPLTPKTETNE